MPLATRLPVFNIYFFKAKCKLQHIFFFSVINFQQNMIIVTDIQFCLAFKHYLSNFPKLEMNEGMCHKLCVFM